MKVDVYEETYRGFTFVARRVLRGSTVKYGGKPWFVEKFGGLNGYVLRGPVGE